MNLDLVIHHAQLITQDFSVVLRTKQLPSAALDVLHQLHSVLQKGVVWFSRLGVWVGKCVTPLPPKLLH